MIEKQLPLLYKDPKQLNSNAHGDLKLAKISDYSFASKTNSIQIVGVEFIEACKEYPIVFVKLADGNYVPSTLNGLRGGENLYINGDKSWDARYIPSYIRRFPFILSEPLEKGDQAVFIDMGSDLVQKKTGDALFNKDGTPTNLLESAKVFLTQHYVHSQLTQKFCEWLAKEDLFMEMTAKFEISKSGENFLFNNLFIINEAKLVTLPAEKVSEIFTKGWLGWIYAHLISLTNFSQLLDRYSKIAPVKKQTAKA